MSIAIEEAELSDIDKALTWFKLNINELFINNNPNNNIINIFFIIITYYIYINKLFKYSIKNKKY